MRFLDNLCCQNVRLSFRRRTETWKLHKNFRLYLTDFHQPRLWLFVNGEVQVLKTDLSLPAIAKQSQAWFFDATKNRERKHQQNYWFWVTLDIWSNKPIWAGLRTLPTSFVSLAGKLPTFNRGKIRRGKKPFSNLGIIFVSDCILLTTVIIRASWEKSSAST